VWKTWKGHSTQTERYVHDNSSSAILNLHVKQSSRSQSSILVPVVLLSGLGIVVRSASFFFPSDNASGDGLFAPGVATESSQIRSTL
jgi:hypothetical protein